MAGSIVVSFAMILMLESGGIIFAVDEPRTPRVIDTIDYLRESFNTRCEHEVAVQGELSLTGRIRREAGSCAAMSVTVRLSTGEADIELCKDLYPEPPCLTQINYLSDSEVSGNGHRFWITEHGNKGSDTPARALGEWNEEMIGNASAFLNFLPVFDAQHYQQSVASSIGHAHEGTNHAGDLLQESSFIAKSVNLHSQYRHSRSCALN